MLMNIQIYKGDSKMQKNRKRFWAIMLAMFLLVSTTPVMDLSAADSTVKVHFIDVGQGDATLIQSGSTYTLIDTGKESSYKTLKRYLNNVGVKKLNLILTHPDSDHIGGADLLVQDFTVKKCYMTKYSSTSMEYKENQKAFKDYKVPVGYAKKGHSISFGGMKGKVLSADEKADDSNSSSICILMKHSKKSFLFTGDAPAKLENKLKDDYDIDVDVLKVSHHGSSSSSPAAYLKEASPDIAVISVGKDNSYGHPTKNVLNRVLKYSKKVYRTDTNGTVVVTSTGSKLSTKVVKGKAQTSASAATPTKKPTVAKPSKKPTPRSKKPASATTGTIIGNVNSKVYPVSSCSRLPKPKNRVRFKSKSAAKKQGYRPCGYCCKSDKK